MAQPQLAISRATSRPVPAEPDVTIATEVTITAPSVRGQPPGGSRRQPVDEVGAQVVAERRAVVLPDRLIQPGRRGDDVSTRPDGGAERQAVADARSGERAGDDAVRRAV